LELEKAAKQGARHGVKIKKQWDSADGYTLTSDGPDTPLHSPPIGLKSFGDGQVIGYRERSASAKAVDTAKRIDSIENLDRM
jgi:hypothetical protein